MGRPVLSDVIKIRKAIIALNDGDFEDLVRDIGIIEEIRDDLKKGRLKGDPPEGQTPVTTEAAK